MARDYDLVLSIFPFEKAWYAKRVPQLRVEFVGHPIVDRYGQGRGARGEGRGNRANPLLVLLPGSRPDELRRHLPVMIGAWELIYAKAPNIRARMVLPNGRLVQQAKAFSLPANLEVQAGGLPDSLAEADAAIASTGTVTTECATSACRPWRSQDVLEHLANRPAHRKGEVRGHAHLLADEESLPGVHPGRRHTGEPRPCGA